MSAHLQADLDLAPALEGLLVVLDRPVDPREVATAWQIEASTVVAALEGLRAAYQEGGHGFVLRETATGWRLFAAPTVRDPVRIIAAPEMTARLSAAALETLAVVAYQQPVSRSRVAAVRGVNVDAVMRTLTTRGLVEILDVDTNTGAARYVTTDAFLDAIGIRSLDELPDLAPLVPDVSSVLGTDHEGSM